MPAKEIRYRKNIFYLFLAIAILPMAGASLAVFTTRPSWQLYLTYVVAMVIVYILIRRYIVMMRSDKPLLIFDPDVLTVNSRRPATIPWSSITRWKITRHKSNYRLVIRTDSGKKSLDITWLEVPAKEIGQLMETYLRYYRGEPKEGI